MVHETDPVVAQPTPGEAPAPRRRTLGLSPLNKRRWSNFRKNRR